MAKALGADFLGRDWGARRDFIFQSLPTVSPTIFQNFPSNFTKIVGKFVVKFWKTLGDLPARSLFVLILQQTVAQLAEMTNSPQSSLFYRPRLGQAADKGLILIGKCNLCHRARAYIAADLLQLYHRDTYIEDLFAGCCPRCGRSEFWRVRQRYPSNSDVGMLTVRKLIGIKQIPQWRDELYDGAMTKPLGPSPSYALAAPP